MKARSKRGKDGIFTAESNTKCDYLHPFGRVLANKRVDCPRVRSGAEGIEDFDEVRKPSCRHGRVRGKKEGRFEP